jgi:regulator of protease activity HflC (stomatin/prohibitin superfamily)
MFDKLIDLVVNFAGLFKFWHIVGPAKEGVVCTWGTETRVIGNTDGWFGTGLHLKAPLDIEEVFDMSKATRVLEPQPQALVSKDGKTVVAGIMITFRVHDVSKAIFSVWDAVTAAVDACQATFAAAVLSTDYDELRTPEFAERLTLECRKLGFKYGFEIDKVRLSELSPSRTIRLINSNHTAEG